MPGSRQERTEPSGAWSLHDGGLVDRHLPAHERADEVAEVAQLDAAPGRLDHGGDRALLAGGEDRILRGLGDVHANLLGTRAAGPSEYGLGLELDRVGDTDLAGVRAHELAIRPDQDRFEDVRAALQHQRR